MCCLKVEKLSRKPVRVLVLLLPIILKIIQTLMEFIFTCQTRIKLLTKLSTTGVGMNVLTSLLHLRTTSVFKSSVYEFACSIKPAVVFDVSVSILIPAPDSTASLSAADLSV